MRAHRSQIAVDGPFFALSNNVGQRAFGVEHFVLARGERGPGTGSHGREDDLFGGWPDALNRPLGWFARTGLVTVGASRDQTACRSPPEENPCHSLPRTTSVTWPTSAGLTALTAAGAGVLAVRDADVGRSRERSRRRRFVRIAAVLWTLVGVAWLRALTMGPGGAFLPLPQVDPFLLTIIVVLRPADRAWRSGSRSSPAGRRTSRTGRSRSTSRSTTSWASTAVKDDVVRSLNLFLAHRTFSRRDGRHPAPRPALRGRPGHRQDPPGPGDGQGGRRAVPVRQRDQLPGMCYGATAKKIRSYFKALRKAARKEGGAIGFIEEIDAIAMSRGGVRRPP